jgi:hypothetical protein
VVVTLAYFGRTLSIVFYLKVKKENEILKVAVIERLAVFPSSDRNMPTLWGSLDKASPCHRAQWLPEKADLGRTRNHFFMGDRH